MLVHSDKVKVKHGLIVIAGDEDPKGLKASYRRQGLRKSLSLSDRLLRFEELIEIQQNIFLQVIPANGQWFAHNRWKPHKNWKGKDKRETYDPELMRLEEKAKARKEAKAKAKAEAKAKSKVKDSNKE